ncbi:hypothetical protein DACRYDRAFT_25415, partial [Dacryopinax primogenitus]
MLHQCGAKEKWVDVELCDHIWVDTVQLANYEFFSGVFRNISIYLSPRYPPGPEGWVHAGTFEARNVRAVQSFHPAPEIEGFHRFVRVVFESYYGGEFYCPVSLLRVYGLNEMEEWKRDKWEEEGREREKEREKEVREREAERAKREWEEKQVRETRTVQVVVVTEEPKKEKPQEGMASNAPISPEIVENRTPAVVLSSPSTVESSPTSIWKSSIDTSTTAATTSTATSSRSSVPETPAWATQEPQESAASEHDTWKNSTGNKYVDAVGAAVENTSVPDSAMIEDALAQAQVQGPAVSERATAIPSSPERDSSLNSVHSTGKTDPPSQISSTSVVTTITSTSTLSTPPQFTPVTAPQSPSYSLTLAAPPLPTGESIYRTIM